MGIGVSVVLMAIGAILAFAVNVHANGLDLNTIGVILMLVGGIGLVTAMIVGGFGTWGGVRRGPVVDEYDAAPRRVVRRDTYVD